MTIDCPGVDMYLEEPGLVCLDDRVRVAVPEAPYGNAGRSVRAAGWTSAGIVGVVTAGIVVVVVAGLRWLWRAVVVVDPEAAASAVSSLLVRSAAPAATTPPTTNAIARLIRTRAGNAFRTMRRQCYRRADRFDDAALP